jgi:hypothetical protein
VALAGSDRLRAPKSVWGCTYAPLKLNDLRLVHWGEFMGSFACSGWAEAQVLGMSEGNLTPTPVRFSAEFIARVDAIAKSMALSHSTVLRLAVNQWFEAGGDKSLLSLLHLKRAPRKPGKRGATVTWPTEPCLTR